ncbi:MAG: LptF/LptG family permease [Flavobacteriales bacterium]|nr:LptF/LptG family permease [Flavobacteriales bacterium]
MKKLHLLMLRSFVGPFFVTFIIVLFILSMQFLWKYVDDLMGKGLSGLTLAQLLTYATASFVPLAIPLAVLLSSIMTMGGLGERSELTPMRSAGLGLFRILMPLTLAAILIAGFSFFFSNNLLPIANLKFQSLLWDVTKKKPAMNLRPGVFYNGIEGFTIRVANKHEDTGILDDVLIYDHRGSFRGDRTVVRAEHGRMKRSVDGNYLVLELQDGRIYDEQSKGRTATGGSMPLLRGRFERDEVRMDLSSLGMKRTDEDLFKDHYKMRTMGQLQVAEDSLMRKYDQKKLDQERYMRNGLFITRDSANATVPGSFTGMGAFQHALDPGQQKNLFDIAINMTRNAASFLDRTLEEREDRRAQIARFRVEWHRKLMLAAACILFFFIGAPLGAIVRKGGMGLPTVFAIVFFLVFHIISYSTEQLVKLGDLQPWPGMWISTLVLLPIGAFLTWKAATDSPLLEADAYARVWDKLRSRFRSRAHPSTL